MQCPQCRQPNDHNARFCVQCGTRVRASACAACGTALSATARFCPSCGTGVTDAVPAPPGAHPAAARDPADALLAARDADGIEDEPPLPDEAELVERVRGDRARRRTLRRSVLVAGVALIVLVAALAFALRSSRAPLSAQAPADLAATAPAAAPETPRVAGTERSVTPPDPATASSAIGVRQPPPRPEPAPKRAAPARVAEPTARDADAVELPPRAARTAARARAPQPREPREELSAMPRAVAPRPDFGVPPRPDLRVEVVEKPTAGAVDYRVRVSRPDGAPVTDADVRLRGVMSDGTLVEAPLEPAAEPGVYQSLLAFSSRGPGQLTVRVAQGDGLLEVPVRAP